MSICDNSGAEYLWQGDPAYWDRRAINLFPYIGRLTNERYYYGGKLYKMGIHGFLCQSVLSVESASDSSICYFLRDDAATLEMYPFPFEIRVVYKLEGCQIIISFDVRNTGSERMFFGVGGHPGFRVPIENGLVFDDYYLEFEEECVPVSVGMSDKCLRNGMDTEFPLKDGRVLPLRHSLFDNDAIVLRNMCRKVTLKSDKGKKGVTVSYPDMPYLGIWHWPKKDSPYVCIEPWSSLFSRDGIVEDIACQPCLIGLDPGGCYVNTWSIELHT